MNDDLYEMMTEPPESILRSDDGIERLIGLMQSTARGVLQVMLGYGGNVATMPTEVLTDLLLIQRWWTAAVTLTMESGISTAGYRDDSGLLIGLYLSELERRGVTA